MSINRVIFGGNLTKDPDLRDVSDTQVCSFRIAHNAYARGGEVTYYFDVSVWGKRASGMHEHLIKGSGVVVDGEYSEREYEHNGEKRTSKEIRASNVQFAGGKAGHSGGAASTSSTKDDSEAIPF